ncbi:deoxynucleoside kinase-like [Anoplophora glabripennis]|uniref:deoxynucleoside kinase-like n=1 Tax=Anoplophora glabripennis TaxID=217634 RepID=UPI00087457DF|nr:deoxynucleoside kinase-like [Anoplophora glabripennis]
MFNSSRRTSRPFTVLVEGNIGSGKTTFLNYFDRHQNVSVLAEPIELWRNCDGHNLLGLMYEDSQKWSFTFQSYVQLTMLQHHCHRSSHPIKLMERSVYSAKYCFVEKMRRDNILSEASAAVIDEHFQWLINNPNTAADLIVYLRTSPEIAYERIIERSRVEEKFISIDYLRELHNIHEEWLFYKNLHYCPAPVIVLNADLDKSSIEEEYQKCHYHIFNDIPISVQG